MQILATLTYAQLREMTAPQSPSPSRGKAMLPVLIIVALVTIYFGWLYYREWQMKRNFRRYWQGKDRKP